MTSEGNSALFPANVDGRPRLQRDLMNFQLQNFQQYNKSLVPRETVNFVAENLNVSQAGAQRNIEILWFSAPVIKCLLFFLSERTIITVRPEDKQVDEGTRVDLRCEATADPSLELKYYWKRDNAVITYNNKIQWFEGAKVLTIASITVDEAGNYTCVAYTPDPKRSEDQASATIDIAGTLLVYTFTLGVFRKRTEKLSLYWRFCPRHSLNCRLQLFESWIALSTG